MSGFTWITYSKTVCLRWSFWLTGTSHCQSFMDAFCLRARVSAADAREDLGMTIREAVKWFDVKGRVDEVSGSPVSRECASLHVRV